MRPILFVLYLKDWTADGRYLVIDDIDEVLGKSALYLLPMQDGKAAGARVMNRYGDFMFASATTSGPLIYQEVTTQPVDDDAYLASLGSEGRDDLASSGLPRHRSSFLFTEWR